MSEPSREPLSQVVVFHSPSATASVAAALAFVEHQPDVDDDLRILAPSDGGRWKVEDLDNIMFAAALRPVVRNLLVVERADELNDGAAARLLKTLEEPPAPTWFLLCVRNPGTLPDPVRGRVRQVIAVPSPPRQDMVATLTGNGLPAEAAARLVELVEPRTELAPALTVKALDGLEQLHEATRHVPQVGDIAAAVTAVDAVAATARPAKGWTGDVERWRTAFKRDLAALTLQRWESATSVALATAALGRHRIDRCEAVARKLDMARSLLERGAPVAAAFSAVS